MKGIIDRFEEDYAIVELENKKMLNINRSKLPKHVKEGDAIIIVHDKVCIDKREAQNRKNRIDDLFKNIFK